MEAPLLDSVDEATQLGEAELVGTSVELGETRNNGEMTAMAAAELGFHGARAREHERASERDEEIGEREGFVVASLSPPMEHGNGGDSRRRSTTVPATRSSLEVGDGLTSETHSSVAQ